MKIVCHLLAKNEEKESLRTFGVSYRKYMERTPKFIPKLWDGER